MTKPGWSDNLGKRDLPSLAKLKDWIVHKKDSELYNFKHTCTQTARTKEKYKLKKRERVKEEKYYCTPMTLMDLK